MKQKLAAVVLLGIGLGYLPSRINADPIINAVPWFCGFEEDEGYTDEMVLGNGEGGWFATEPNCVVQTDVVCSDPPFVDSLQAVSLGEDVTLSNEFDGAPMDRVWFQIDARASRDDGDEDPEVDEDATVLFFIESEGYFRVNNITDRQNPDPQWETITKTITGKDAVPYETNTWVRLNICQNYDTKTWALFVNYQLITNSINFVNPNAVGLSGFGIYNGADAVSYLDNISITNTLPADLAEDGGDWLPDLNLSETAFSHVVFPGGTIDDDVFEVFKTENYYDLVFSSVVECATGNWLSVDPEDGVDDGSRTPVTVAYNVAGLDVGTYTATITVRAWDPEFGFEAKGSPQVIDVEVRVMNSPVLKTSPSVLVNEVAEGQKASAQYFKLWNDSVTPRERMGYTVTKDSSWITVNPQDGFCIDNTNTVTLTYNTATLEPGLHTGTVTVAVIDPVATSQNVKVHMRVNARPVLAITEDIYGWTNEIAVGGAWDPVSFNVWNGSDTNLPMGKLKFDLSDDMEWLSFNIAGGISTGEEHEVVVTFDTAELLPGIYTGEIEIAGYDDATGELAVDAPRQLGVKLIVRGEVTLSTTLRDDSVTVLEGCTATNQFLVWNGAGDPDNAMSYWIANSAPWLKAIPSSGVVADDTNIVSMVFDSAGLEIGSYAGVVTVDAVGVSNQTRALGAPQSAAISMRVVSRTPVNFELPEISGVAQVGQTVFANKGLWQNEDRLTFSYQWQRASDYLGTDLTDIPGATLETYTITENDKGAWLRVQVTATDAHPYPLSTTVLSLFESSTRIKVVPGDFSGDGKTDLWFFDAPFGMWRIAYAGGGTAELQFGSWETLAVPGDYDGNGVMDFAVYHQTDGTWYVLFMPHGTLGVCQFGWWETVPIPGDYDGDGITDVAVYWPQGGIWYILYSSLWMWDYTQFGWADTTPIPGDYDGDGITDLAIYHDGIWTILGSSGKYWSISLGGEGAYPAPGDYDGDGIDDIAVYWQAENRWEILLSSTGKKREKSFGTSNGVGFPMPGYYDSDSLCDPATVHISGDFLIWCVLRSSEGYRGQSYQPSIDRWRVSW